MSANRALKYVIVPIALILLLVTASGILIVGGTVDFDHSYDEDGNIILENRSSGLLIDFRWEAVAYSGNSVSIDEQHPYEIIPDGKIKLMTTGIDVFEVTLYCKTIAGVEWAVTKDVSNGEFKEYVVDFTYPYGIGETYSVTVQVSTSDFISYKNEAITRFPGAGADQALVTEFINVLDNDTIMNITDQFGWIFSTEGITNDEEKVNIIMTFVQNCIEYKYDQVTMGALEYWKYPIETLFTRTGDCEDVSLLTMALFKAYFGEEASVALALFWSIAQGAGKRGGHAMAAISISGLIVTHLDQDMTDYIINGKEYYLCETTRSKRTVEGTWTVGRVEADYNTGPSMLIVV